MSQLLTIYTPEEVDQFIRELNQRKIDDIVALAMGHHLGYLVGDDYDAALVQIQDDAEQDPEEHHMTYELRESDVEMLRLCRPACARVRCALTEALSETPEIFEGQVVYNAHGSDGMRTYLAEAEDSEIMNLLVNVGVIRHNTDAGLSFFLRPKLILTAFPTAATRLTHEF